MLTNLRNRYPVAAACGCALLQLVVTLAILLAGKALLPPEQFGKVRLAAFGSTLLVPVVLAQMLGLWRDLGLQRFRVRPFFAISLLVWSACPSCSSGFASPKAPASPKR